jgi:ribokinase
MKKQKKQNKQFDVITFGSATQDTFFFLPEKSYSIEKRQLCLPFGGKIYVENMQAFSGGGGTNTAAGFARQGLKTACVGKIGEDRYGRFIKEDLEKNGVDTRFLIKDKKLSTAFSAIISYKNDRNILVHHGASNNLQEKDIPWSKIKSKIFYIAPLTNNDLLFRIVKNAKKQKAFIVFNPGRVQLELGMTKLRPILKESDVLILNLEEAKQLSKENNEREIAKKLKKEIKGILVITKGENGSIALDQNGLWQADTPPIPVNEKTGAGDAFGSGFIAEFLRSGDTKKSLQYGTANAVSCFGKLGTKNGLLTKSRWGKTRKAKVTLSVR